MKLAIGASLAKQIISIFGTWVLRFDHGLPIKYGICSVLVIIGAIGRLAIIMESFGSKDGVGNVCDKTGIGKGRGV